MRRAFTLPELVLILAVTGILAAIAVPLLSRTVDRIEVHTAVAHLVAAHQRARIMAIAKGQVLVLSVDSATLRIAPPDGVPVLWWEAGPAAAGVTLPGPSRRFTFSPEGITLGLSNATLPLSRGTSTRTIIISRLGRVRVQ